ncbi:MAG: restriction endonuclease subunit S [Dialister sp.]|nr:restriction endonuclease subunit S [Dialister sp.]
MAKIDTSGWKPFVVGDLFDIHPTKAHKMTNAQLMDDGNNPVVVNSSYNNGIGGYSTQPVTEKGVLITFSDTTTAEAVFYQPNDFIGYPHVQGMYPKGQFAKKWQENQLLFFVAAFKKAAVLCRFDYAYKFTREIASAMEVLLPVDSHGCPDWAYMDSFMAKVMKESEACLENLRLADEKKTAVDISQWKEFEIGDLFPKIKKPPVLHNRQVIEDENGIPYIVRTKFDNGMKCRVRRNDEMVPSPAGVISFGAENATFFYQREEFVSGRDIYYIDTRELSAGACMFLTACLQPVARKYSYNYGLFPDLLKSERIKLPVDSHGAPDWTYMDAYMQAVMNESEKHIGALSEPIASCNAN